MKKILIAIAIISAIGTTGCSDKEQVNASDSISLQTLGTYQTSILRVSNNGISVSKKLR